MTDLYLFVLFVLFMTDNSGNGLGGDVGKHCGVYLSFFGRRSKCFLHCLCLRSGRLLCGRFFSGGCLLRGSLCGRSRRGGGYQLGSDLFFVCGLL